MSAQTRDVRHRTRGHERSGVALASVLMATIVLGIVIAGVFFASSQEVQIGRNLVEQEQARGAAELGLASVVEGWDPVRVAELGVGASLYGTVTTHEGATISTYLTRLGPTTYWAVAEARAGHPGAEAVRVLGAAIRLEIPDLRPLAALSVHSPVEDGEPPLLAGDIRISGKDAAPAGWEECRTSGSVPGLVVTDTMEVDGGGMCPDGCLSGDPPLQGDPTLGDTTNASVFDVETWRELTSRAAVVLGAGTVLGTPERPIHPYLIDGRCDTSIDHNWGDPLRATPCAGYFPVIHARGDLVLAGGSGQGVLLVDGTLTMYGGASFTGVVLVRGGIRTGAGDAHLVGIVRAGGRTGVSSTLGDGTTIAFSRCAVLAAFAATAPPALIPRSWVDVHR